MWKMENSKYRRSENFIIMIICSFQNVISNLVFSNVLKNTTVLALKIRKRYITEG